MTTKTKKKRKPKKRRKPASVLAWAAAFEDDGLPLLYAIFHDKRSAEDAASYAYKKVVRVRITVVTRGAKR